MTLGARHALIAALRNPRSEPELTQALAAVLGTDPKMASDFVRLVLTASPRGQSGEASGLLQELPPDFVCAAEESVAEGRLDLGFRSLDGGWLLMVELKIDAGYGHEQLSRYLRSLGTDARRQALVAITRVVPTYGDPALAEDPRWSGSVRWGRVLAGLRALAPADPELARAERRDPVGRRGRVQHASRAQVRGERPGLREPKARQDSRRRGLPDALERRR